MNSITGIATRVVDEVKGSRDITAASMTITGDFYLFADSTTTSQAEIFSEERRGRVYFSDDYATVAATANDCIAINVTEISSPFSGKTTFSTAKAMVLGLTDDAQISTRGSSTYIESTKNNITFTCSDTLTTLTDQIQSLTALSVEPLQLDSRTSAEKVAYNLATDETPGSIAFNSSETSLEVYNSASVQIDGVKKASYYSLILHPAQYVNWAAFTQITRLSEYTHKGGGVSDFFSASTATSSYQSPALHIIDVAITAGITKGNNLITADANTEKSIVIHNQTTKDMAIHNISFFGAAHATQLFTLLAGRTTLVHISADGRWRNNNIYGGGRYSSDNPDYVEAGFRMTDTEVIGSTTPFEVVAAVNKYIDIKKITFKYNHGSAAFTGTGQTFNIKVGSTTIYSFTDTAIGIGGTVDKVTFVPVASYSLPVADKNQPVTIENTGTVLAVGTGAELDVMLEYKFTNIY
jgi:hypothetical protein